MTVAEYNICVEQYADRVYRFVLKNAKQTADAQDVVQNAFEILWKNRHKVPMEKARAYLFSVAYRNGIDQFRKWNRVYASDVLSECMAQTASDTPDLKDLLEEGLQQLSEVQRSLILLRDYEGYSYQEIAQIAELSVSQVKVYIFRGRKKLQQFLVSIDKLI